MRNHQRIGDRLAAILPMAALIAALSSCHNPGSCLVGPTPGPLVTIDVTPNPDTTVVNTTQQFVATGYDANNNVVAITPAPTWSVVAGGGTINIGSGLFTAGGATGPFPNTIKATSGVLSDLATVIVTAGTLTTITVTPNPATMVVNTTQQFVATGTDANNNVVVITPAPTWSVVASGGTINSVSGLFTAGGVTGTFSNTIKATSGVLSGLATVTVTDAPPPNILGSAGTFAVLAGSTVSNTGSTTTIAGDVGLSPGTMSGIVGIPAGQPNPGAIYAGVTSPAGTAQSALTTAYNDLAGRPCGTNLTSQDLGGLTLAAGVYCFSSTALLTGTLSLTGNANSVFVFQIGSALTTASSSAVNLIGGAQAKNVYWQVGSSATIGTGAAFKGNIVALQSITLNTNATLSGRALARNGAVTLDTNAITLP